MALQDLTPQLRTRLGRMEHRVGFFVFLAALLLIAGFSWYIFQTAKRKGWFITQAPYFTFVRTAAGIKVGDPVKLMGFDVGEITKIEAMPPSDPEWNVYVEFRVRAPYFGYLWEDSRSKLASGDFLGNRFLEVTKGTNGPATYQVDNGKSSDIKPHSVITGIWDENRSNYAALNRSFEKYVEKDQAWKPASPYWLKSEESPALADRLEMVVNSVQKSLPGVFALTNQVSEALGKSSALLAKAADTVTGLQPLVSNLAAISAQLRQPQGSLGDWLLPTNLNSQIALTLTQASQTIQTAETNLNNVGASLTATLLNLAEITSNLNAQVQANSLILSEISSLVANADDLVQGLKRNWLLKASFQTESNKPLQSVVQPGVRGLR